jgi:hypothetical protein
MLSIYSRLPNLANICDAPTSSKRRLKSLRYHLYGRYSVQKHLPSSLSESFPIQLIKPPLEVRIRLPNLIYHPLRPFKVFPFPVDRPVVGRRCQNIPPIADLVGQLDELGPSGGPARASNLQLLC